MQNNRPKRPYWQAASLPPTGFKGLGDYRRGLFNHRTCFVCGGRIPEAKGVYCAPYRILVCYEGPCKAEVDLCEKDRTKTKKGRYRPTGEVLRLLAERRGQIEKRPTAPGN